MDICLDHIREIQALWTCLEDEAIVSARIECLVFVKGFQQHTSFISLVVQLEYTAQINSLCIVELITMRSTGNFRITLNLIMKSKLRAKFFIRKLLLLHMKEN